MKYQKTNKGFTIVELLIVVVVIAILAAITIVSYNGIKDRAQASKLQSDLSQTAKKIETVKTTSGTETYPDTLVSAGFAAGTTNNLTYSVTAQGKGYCLNGQDGPAIYNISSISGTPRPGSCGTVQGLVGWWPMNGDVQDKSGNNIQSTPVNVTPTAGVGNQPNTAYSFNGTSSQILCGTSPLLRPTDEVTVTAWVKPSGFSSGQAGILSNGTGGYRMTLANTGVPRMSINNTTYTASSTPAFTLNNWYFLNVRYKSSQQQVTVESYQYSSAQDASTAGILSQGAITNYGTSECQIGSVNGTVGQYFNGLIDDVRVYNRVLTGEETDALFYSGAY